MTNRVNELVKNGRLDLPSNYSLGNAMSSAWLILQGTKDKNGVPVLKACTQPSIANAFIRHGSYGVKSLQRNKDTLLLMVIV